MCFLIHAFSTVTVRHGAPAGSWRRYPAAGCTRGLRQAMEEGNSHVGIGWCNRHVMWGLDGVWMAAAGRCKKNPGRFCWWHGKLLATKYCKRQLVCAFLLLPQFVVLLLHILYAGFACRLWCMLHCRDWIMVILVWIPHCALRGHSCALYYIKHHVRCLCMLCRH